MGQHLSGGKPDKDKDKSKEGGDKSEKRKYEAPIPTRLGKRKKGGKGPDAASKLPTGIFFSIFQIYIILVTPHARCRLRVLKFERTKDYLLMEQEFIRNQERLKPQEERQEVYFLFKDLIY